MTTPLEFGSSSEKVLAVLPLFSGLLSLLGSLWIIVEVSATKAKRSSVYNRLLLGMSIVDVMTSIAYMCSTLPMPANSYEVLWAFGTAETCTAQGFFVHLGLVAPIYHVCLSVYYLLIVKFQVTEYTIARSAEPIMHSAALLIGFGTAFASISLGLFNNASLWCWIAPLPSDCDLESEIELGETCEQGKNTFVYILSFFYIPLWLSMFAVLGINVWIYRTVRRRELKAEKLHAIHTAIHGSSEFFMDIHPESQKTTVGRNKSISSKTSMKPTRKDTKNWQKSPRPGSSDHPTSAEPRFPGNSRRSSIRVIIPEDMFKHMESSEEMSKHSTDRMSYSEKMTRRASAQVSFSEENQDGVEGKERDDSRNSNAQVSFAEENQNGAEGKERDVSRNSNAKVSFSEENQDGVERKERDVSRNSSAQVSFAEEMQDGIGEESDYSRISNKKVGGKKNVSTKQNEDKETRSTSLPQLPIGKGQHEKEKIHEKAPSPFLATPFLLGMMLPEKFAQRISRRNLQKQPPGKQETKIADDDDSSVGSATAEFVLKTIEDYPSAARQCHSTYHIGARLVLYQSIGYVVGFWIIWLMPTINQLVQHYTGNNYYSLLFLQALLEPLQGLFNVGVYRTSHYLKLKQLHPRWTRQQLLQNTLRFSFLGPPEERIDKRTKESDEERSDKRVEECSQVFLEIQELSSSSVGMKGSPVDKQKKDEEAQNSVEGTLIDDGKEIDTLDSDLGSSSYSNHSAEYSKPPKAMRRTSSLMGDLMSYCMDDPSLFDENCVKISGEESLPSPTSVFPFSTRSSFPNASQSSFQSNRSSFPTVYDATSFSGINPVK